MKTFCVVCQTYMKIIFILYFNIAIRGTKDLHKIWT